MEETLKERLDKIENMLRHIHGHIEEINDYGWVNRESMVDVLRILGDNMADIMNKKISGEELGNYLQNFHGSCSEFLEDSYSPIDEKDKEEHDKKEEERERIRNKEKV